MVCYPLMYNHKLPWIDEINLFRWFCPVQVSCCKYLVPYFMIDWMNKSFISISPQENFMFLNFCKFFLYIQFSWKKGFVFIFQLKQNIHIKIENLKLKQSCNRKCKLIWLYNTLQMTSSLWASKMSSDISWRSSSLSLVRDLFNVNLFFMLELVSNWANVDKVN